MPELEGRRGCVIFCHEYKYLYIVYILSITEFKFRKLSDLRFEALKRENQFSSKEIWVYMTDLYREICKHVKKLDFMPHGMMEFLLEFLDWPRFHESNGFYVLQMPQIIELKPIFFLRSRTTVLSTYL